MSTKADAERPRSDPREAPFFDLFAAAERTALARILPRRNRWADLLAFDQRIADVEQQQARLNQELGELFQQQRTAGPDHERALVSWHANGAKGPRPEPTAAAIAERIAQLQADHAALGVLLEQTASEKGAFVARHRKRLVADARRERDRARDRYLSLIGELVGARSELTAAAQTVVWTSLFPHPSLATDPDVGLLAAGQSRAMREAVPGLNLALTLENVVRLLEADAGIVADARSREQQAALAGIDPRQLDAGAHWTGTEEGRQAERAEKKAARERFKREHGYELPEFSA
jgi:hypothetical protein